MEINCVLFYERIISVLSIWIFWFYICDVPKMQSVKIFKSFKTIPKDVKEYEPFVTSKTCLLVPQHGPCRSTIRMWYFDPSKSNCSRFEWGGCQGNGNRFNTFNECWGFCVSKPGNNKFRPRYCSLTFDYGFCFGAVERWYFDANWKVCKTTIYSGCGGNKNNFYNKEQCDAICRFGIGSIPRKANFDTLNTTSYINLARTNTEANSTFNATTVTVITNLTT